MTKIIKVSRTYKLHPDMIARIEHAANVLGKANTDILEIALEKYLKQVERTARQDKPQQEIAE